MKHSFKKDEDVNFLSLRIVKTELKVFNFLKDIFLFCKTKLYCEVSILGYKLSYAFYII